MKKVIAIILAFTMLLQLNMVSFADEDTKIIYSWGYMDIGIHTGEATYHSDWDNEKWEKAFIESYERLSATSFDDKDFYNYMLDTQAILAGWSYYIWNLEGSGINSEESILLNYTDYDGINIELLYDPEWDQEYYISKYNYLVACKNTDYLLYSYYINKGLAKKSQRSNNETINIDEINKLLTVYIYDLKYKAGSKNNYTISWW